MAWRELLRQSVDVERRAFIDCQINYELLFREVDELVREFLVRSGLGGKGNEALYHVEGS